MKILVVASDKGRHFGAFVEEQMTALAKGGVEIQRFPITSKGFRGYLRALPNLLHATYKYQPDIVHAHFGLSALLANLQRRVPVVSTYHGSDIHTAKTFRFSKWAMRLSAWNIFVSKRTIDIANPQEKFSLIPCGINLPPSWSELKVRTIGQLTYEEWVKTVLIPDRKHVLFAGAFDNTVKDPELAKAVMTHLPDVQLIELKGYNREQVNTLMYNCDVLLMTSVTEGSPQVIKEAMACGCPIVSTDVGDVSELVDGVEGCYVAKSREPQKIAGLVIKALDLGHRTEGRKRIQDQGLTNEQVTKKLMDVYNRVL